MPVSLSEWRVRIGTFVHWIREYEVKERRERLLKERIRRLRLLCERLESKIGDSGEESEDDKSRQDGPDPKGCPHKTANIRSSGNSSDIKDLLTSCDQCIQDLLTASDSHIKEILTPSDTCIKQLQTPRRESLERIRRLKVLCERLEAKMGDSGEESEDDNSRQDGSDPKGCPHKTANIRSSENSSDIKDLLTSCDQCIQYLLTASDSQIKEILTPSGCSIKELMTPNDCSIKSQNTLNGSTIKNAITPNDFGIKGLLTTNDSIIQNLVEANDDSRIQDLVKSNDDSRIQDLLKTNYSSIRDPITPKYCSIKEVIVSKNDSSKPLDIPNASSIKDLITPNDSSIIGLITSEYYNVKDLIASNDSKINSLLTPNETNIKRLIKPDDDYIEEQLAQAYDYVKTCTSDDESIEQDRQVGDLEEQQMSDFSISPRHSLSDASLRERLTSYPSTKDLRTPTDYSNTDLLLQTSYIKDHETQSDGSVKELLSPGSGTTVCRPFAPCDDFLVELLKSTVSASKDLPSIDLCCHEPDRQNEPFSEESAKFSHFVGKEQHHQPDTFSKEATDDELFKEHHTSAVNCKKSHTETSILMAVKRSPMVPFVSRKNCIGDRYGEKQMGESASSCHGPSLKSKTDLICGQIPPLSELLLLKSGDVELNPGPREAAGWSVDLEKEVLSLVKDVSPVQYYDLCNALDFSHAQSQVILTKNLLDVSNALSEVICSWGVKQRDGTNYKSLLAEKLRSVHLDSLGTKLVEGGYSTQDFPTQSSVTDEVHHVNKLPQEKIVRCGKDFKTFYRTVMCKIKTDPLDFDSLKEFENIYTNLVLLRNEMGTNIKTPLEYDDLLTKQINGEFPKRLLVEGEGGAGKTTFCSKIAWDWTNGYEAYKHFEWVIVIPMREIQNGKSVGDIAKTYLSDGNMVQPRQIDDYILSEPSKVLLIFDGLDEYSRDIFSDESDFGKIIRSEKFKECIILITSRPWRANQIKSHQTLYKIYTFIGVEGFSSKNVSFYINKYFVDDNMAGADLIKFMEDNDVIKENMAPFPIYVAMLCILWRESTKERREVIRKLKTFSQLFYQMIAFLKEHYISKSCNTLTEFHSMETESINKFLIEIGKIAFSGLLGKRLTFNEKDFSLCKEAMDVCSKIGFLSREKQFVRRVKRAGTKIQPVTFDVSFPHKLFQEYVAALYLTSLYESKDVEYTTSINKILKANVYEFKYLLYFTSSQGKDVGLDIINSLVKQKCEDDFLVDVAFEAYDADSGKVVGQRIFREQNSLEINEEMSTHTLSGYLFIMEQHAMKTFILHSRECGSTVSRDLADALSSQTSLTTLTLSKTKFHDDFYRILLDHVSTSKIHKLDITSLELCDNQSASCCLGKFVSLLPHLTDLMIDICSFHDDFYKEIADRASSSRIQKFIISSLDLHVDQSASCCLGKFLGLLPHMTHLEICSCSFHGDFYKEIADQASSSQIQTVNLDFSGNHYLPEQSQSAFKQLAKFLCSLPCLTTLEIKDNVCLPDDFFTELASFAASSQIHTVNLDRTQDFVIPLESNLPYKQLAKFLCSLPRLTTLAITGNIYVHDDFFTELASLAASSQIQTIILQLQMYPMAPLVLSNLASKQLDKFLCSLPCLTTFLINGDGRVRDDFFTELESLAASSQIQTVNLDLYRYNARQGELLSQSASKQLAKFLCSLPCLTTLMINGNERLPDDFVTELKSLAASSQNPYFREKQHISMIQEWSVRKQQQQRWSEQQRQQQQQQQWLQQQQQQQLQQQQREQQQQRWLEQQRQQKQQQQWWSVRRYHQQQQQQLNQCERPMPSTHRHPYLPHHVPPLESAPPSGQFQSFHHRGFQSEPEQINQPSTYQQLSPIMPLQSPFATDQLTKQHLEEFGQYLQSYLSARHNANNGHGTQYLSNLSYQEKLEHPPHHGLGEATQDTAVIQRQEDATPIETDDTLLSSSSVYINSRTSVYQGGLSIGMKPIYENDDNLAMPSTSGLRSAQSRTDAAPVEIEQITEHRKRIHSDEGDDGDRVDESLEQPPRKRRAKTDRQPTSP